MHIDGWKYYNHAAIPTCAPHEAPDLRPINNGTIWKMDGKPLLARWTTDWDCGYETDWWYCIKDAPYIFESLPRAQRKHIRQALKRLYVEQICPLDYADSLYHTFCDATSRYTNYSNKTTNESFLSGIKRKPPNATYWGAFRREDDHLAGYFVVLEYDEYINISVAKFSPQFLKEGTSDALYHVVLEYYLNNCCKKYCNSGERCISHDTNTQEYKIEKFGYRKCYCRLQILYRPIFKILIKILYPIRFVLKPFDKIHIIHLANSVLLMEGIRRRQ